MVTVVRGRYLNVRAWELKEHLMFPQLKAVRLMYEIC